MNYTLNQLRIFLKIVESQSITKASEALNLTQPAVSIQLKNFQQQFEIPLTEVVGRKLYITDFGKEIAEAAAKIIEQVHAINFKTHSYKGYLTGKLKIAVVSTGKYVMPYLLSDFMKQHSGVELQMDVTNKLRVLESLEKNEVDFVLMSVIPPNLNMDSFRFFKNQFYLVGKEIPPYMDTVNPLEVFQDLPLIYREKGSGTREVMEQYFRGINLNPVKMMELSSNEAVKQALLAGLGYSVMPHVGIRKELTSGELSIIPVQGLPIQTTWQLVWQKGKKHSPVAASYLAYLETHHSKLVKTHLEHWG